MIPTIVLLLLLQAAFARWTATGPWSFVHFVAAAFLFLLLPGRAVLRGLRVRVSPLEETLLALILGAAAASGFYWLSMLLKAPALFFLWPLAGVLATVASRRWPRPDPPPPAPSGAYTGLVGVFAAGLVPLLLIPIYFRNAARLPSGGMSFYPFQDVIFHLGIGNELTHSIPAQVPFMPGLGLSYHYGMDLLAAMMAREGRLSVLDLATRFLPTLFVGLVVAAVFCFASAWLRSAWAGVAAAFLVIFGEDFSFLPGLFRPAQNPWAVEFFGMPTIVSLFLMNPMLPALALLLAGLFCLMRSLDGGGRGWQLLAAVLFAALAAVKVFTLAHVLASLVLAGLLHWWRFRDRRLLATAAVAVVLTAPLLALSWLEGGPKAVVQFHPWPYVPGAIIKLGWWDSPLGEHLDEWLRRGHATPAALAAFFGIALPLYLIGAMGLRVVALPTVLKQLARPSPDPLRTALAVFVVLGPLVSLSCAVTPAGYPPRAQYNDAVWFFVQSKYVAWLFVVEVLRRLWSAGGPVRRAVLLAATAALSLPSTVQYLAFQLAEAEMQTLERSAVETTDFLNRNARPGTVVLSRGATAEAVLALTRCRTPHPAIWPGYFISREELERRAKELEEFWAAWSGGGLRRDILDSYHAEYAVVDTRRDGPGPPSSDLDLRFESGAFRVFAVAR